MSKLEIFKNPTFHITMGADPVNLIAEGIWVRNGQNEIEYMVQNYAKTEIENTINEKYADILNQIEAKMNDFSDNALEETIAFNQNVSVQTDEALTSISEATLEAENWAIGDIETEPNGSAKYWAEQAKMNYEDALVLADEINGEEI